MKFNLVGNATVFLLGASVLVAPGSLHAGWGILRGGSTGGSTGFGSGGSGGYAASYGSGGSGGGYTASYSSVGGGSVGGGSTGAFAYGSGGSSGGPGILQRVASRIHTHLAAKHARHAARRASFGSGGSGGYGSSGGYTSYASAGGGSSGGYTTSYSSYSGGSTGGSAGYGSAGYGSTGASVSYGSTGVSYGSTGAGVSYGSTGVSYGSTGYSSGVSYGSTGYSSGFGSSGEVYYGASNSEADTSSLVSDVKTDNDTVYLSVAVPTDAKVFVNDDATKSSGAVRKFVSHGLETGKQYRFVVRAELTGADGKLMTEEKTVLVSAGQQEDVQFAFSESKSPVETAITLNLPEGAKVLLAGNETNATGETRTYRTSRLKVGELWDDYEIEVQYDGKVKRQSVRLVGGDKLQLTFNFEQDASNLAAR